MDLYMILCEYEQFYEMKFGRPPKLTVKKAGTEGKILLPFTVLTPTRKEPTRS